MNFFLLKKQICFLFNKLNCYLLYSEIDYLKKSRVSLLVIITMLLFSYSAGAVDTNSELGKESGKADTVVNDTDSTDSDIKSDQIAAEMAELKAQVAALQTHNQQRELAELQADAEAAANSQSDSSDDNELKTKSFKGGERSLQALNPEISVVGDIFAQFVHQDGEVYSAYGRTGFFPRVLGLHLQSNLDPFSFAKMAIGIHPDGIEMGEAYVTWSAVTPWLSLTFGKFHQQFGVVNRWHAPSLDQFGYPLVLAEHFGGSLNQTGVSALFRLPPLWADSLELELQITNGQNGKLFSGNFFSIPSGLVHLKNYWDLNRNTYAELGLSGVIGVNNQVGKTVQSPDSEVQLYDKNGAPVTFYDKDGNPVTVAYTSGESVVQNDKDWRLSVVGGADFTFSWAPVNQSKYKGFTWRTEFLYAYKQIKDSAGQERSIHSWGGYSYVQYKPFRNWIFGVRGDMTTPFELDNKDKYTWAAVPYITWWQSPWVRFRLEYNYINWADAPEEHRAILQMTFSAGPHKHDRY